jgi:hypothetical protein
MGLGSARRELWVVGFFTALAVCFFGTAASALAVTPSVTIDTRTPVLEKAENGASKIGLTFLNLTDGEAQLSAKPEERPACVLTLDKTKLEPAESKAVAISVPASCKASEGLVFDVTATAGSTPLASFKVVPEVKPVTEPKWDNLLAFPIALGAIWVLLVFFFFRGWRPAEGAKRSVFQRLYLDATWKFNDNWATNVSAVGAILTGVFGATTAKAFLGPDAESAVALATVGAAVALALVAAGPVIALATKTFKVVPVVTEDGKPVKKKDGKPATQRLDAFTVGGLLFAASVIFASAFGQLWVVMATGEELELGGLEDDLWIPFGLAALLLVLYGYRSLKDLLERGTAKPQSEDPDEVKAAKLIVAALTAKKSAEEKPVPAPSAEGAPHTVAKVKERIAVEEAIAGDSYVQRQRSVLP